MAYTPANLSLVSNAPLTGAGQSWVHSSTDATGDVDADGYFSDAGSRGVKVGDIIYHRNTTTAAAVVTSAHTVNTVSATYPGAANVSVGVVIGTGGTSGD